MGSKGIRSRIDGSRTTTSFVIESTSARPVAVSTSVTRVSHSEDSRGVSSGTGRIGERAALDGGDAAQHGGVLQHLGSPGLEDPARRLGQGQHPEQVAHDVVDGDRLGAGGDPSGRDHGGQVLDELAGQLPGNAAVPDDDPGPDDGHRDAGRSEQLLDLTAAAQVRRQRVLVVAEPSEVDDALQPGPRPRLPECRRGGGVFAFEIRVGERVHEVVGHLAAGHRGAQGGGVVNVCVDGCAGPGVTGGVAGHGDDVVAGAGQGRAQPAADETGRAGHEHFHRGHPACPASVTGSPASSRAPTAVGDLRRGAGSGQCERSALGERGELGSVGLEGLRQGRGQDDEVRAPRVDRPRQLLDRGVHPEIVDPPPVAVEHDAEDHQRQVVKLPGGAGQDGAGAVPVPPAPGQPSEPPADDVACEVLLGDAGRSTLPALPEFGEIRHHNVAEHCRQGEVGHEPVKDCLRGWLVEGVEGLPEGTGELTRRPRGAVRPGGPAEVRPGPGVLPEHCLRCLGGRQPVSEVGLHPADPRLVRLGVQPEAAR